MVTSPDIKVAQVIWAAMFLSQISFIITAFFAGVPPSDSSAIPGLESALAMPMTPALAMAALMTTAAIPIARKAVMGKFCLPFINESSGSASMDNLDEPDDAAIDQALAELKKATARYQTGTIIGLACAESACLFGLSLSFVVHYPPIVIPFFAWAWFWMGLQWPSEKNVFAIMPPDAAATLGRNQT